MFDFCQTTGLQCCGGGGGRPSRGERPVSVWDVDAWMLQPTYVRRVRVYNYGFIPSIKLLVFPAWMLETAHHVSRLQRRNNETTAANAATQSKYCFYDGIQENI